MGISVPLRAKRQQLTPAKRTDTLIFKNLRVFFFYTVNEYILIFFPEKTTAYTAQSLLASIQAADIFF